jgi:hypothetical protein
MLLVAGSSSLSINDVTTSVKEKVTTSDLFEKRVQRAQHRLLVGVEQSMSEPQVLERPGFALLTYTTMLWA